MVNHFLQAGFVLTSLFQTITATYLSPPTGLYNAYLLTTQLTDKNRPDPFSPTKAPRSLMVSIFNPILPSACSPGVAPYMDATTAKFQDTKYGTYGLPAGTFGALFLQVCVPKASSRRTPMAQAYPIVLFSPALGTSRLVYSALAQQLSSTGYTVVTIDHPYDVDIVTYPDNSTVLGANIDSDADVLLAVNTRVKDMSFVLNQLARPSMAKNLFPGLTCGLDVSKVGVFGHSLGGAAAAEALRYDSRLVGGINLDGSFFGDIVKKGVNQPLLIFGHEGKDTTTDPSWAAVWSNLKGWKRILMLADSAHYTFSDLSDILKVSGLRSQLPAEISQVLGTIDGERALEIVAKYVGSFFDFVLKGKKNGLLDGPASGYPGVLFGSP